ncbi:glycine-rich RNA-binding protein 2-like isoform X2 [Aricia agestis]|nr:glycine-rich RNA-binding protein 2-like isoform X2 [Aricia agestis]
MAATKLLALFTIVLVATEIVAALSDSIPQDVSLDPTLEHAVYSRVKRQNYPYGYGNGGRNSPMPILIGGGGFGGRNYGGRGGMGYGGRGGARGGFGGARGGFGGGRGRG